MQNVVLVGGNHQPPDRQAHFARDVACEDVAEIAGGHGEIDLPVRRAKADGGGEVIDHLCQHPAPVDRVHPRQPDLIAKCVVVEHVLQPCLRIVEIAVNRQRVHVGLNRRGHLAALHIRNAAMREENEHIDIIKPAKRLDRRRSGIARGGADNGDAAALLGQFDLKKLPDHLHGEILERQRRAVEKFQQVMAGGKLHQGRAGGVAKARVGAGKRALQARHR